MLRTVVCCILVGAATTCLAQTSGGPFAKGKTDDGDFLVVGGGIGSPAGITLIGGYYFKPLVLRVSGGYWKKGWDGVQGDLGINLSRSSSFAMGVSLVAGRFRANPLNDQGEKQLFVQNYVGLTYDMYLSGFFLQAGLGAGNGDYPNPQVLFQIGYLFELH